MRIHGILLFTAIAALFLAPSFLPANTISDSIPAAPDTLDTTLGTTPDTLQTPLADVPGHAAAPLFPTSAEQTSIGQTSAEPAPLPEQTDLLSLEFLASEQGAFPASLYRAEDSLNPVPEPSSTGWLPCGLLTIAWIGRRKQE